MMSNNKMKNILKNLLKNVSIFIVCGTIYYLLETVFKANHTSDWSMFICAGVIGLIASLLNNFFTFNMLLQYQLGISAIVATIIEGFTGLALCCFNEGVNPVWDYSRLWGTFFYEQCNIFFCLLWFILSFIAILLGDSIEYYIFDSSERPYYCINSKGIWFWLPRKNW